MHSKLYSNFRATSTLVWLSTIFIAAIAAASPLTLLSPSEGGPWAQPVYSNDGKFIAFADTSYRQIWVFEAARNEARRVADATGIGRRFVFEPGDDRVVYRQFTFADPLRAEQLVSTSVYMFDPAVRTDNRQKCFGPYLIQDTVWYRQDLRGALLRYDGTPRAENVFLDRDPGRLWITAATGDTTYVSPPGMRIAGMEISPSGKWVCAVQDEPSRAINLIRVRTGELITVGRGVTPSWSGDGLSLVYVTRDDIEQTRALEVYRMKDNSRESVYTSKSLRLTDPALNYDGTKVAFIGDGALYQLELSSAK